MRILQIAGGFTYSNVYKELFHTLHSNGIEQQVYNPQHVEDQTNIKSNEYLYDIYSSKIIRKIDKFLYFTRLHRIIKDIERRIDLSKVSLIHAHSLYSDGGIAYLLSKKYGIPYVVAVRNTDVNKYYKYAIHLRKFALQILLSSTRCIFISLAYKSLLIKRYVPQKYKVGVNSKSVVIPNAIGKFWFDNLYRKKRIIDPRNIRVISVGVINRNKNFLSSIKACDEIMKEQFINIEYYLIGKVFDKNYFKKIRKYNFVKYLGYVNHDELLNLYRNADIYIMPSINETFGLVYVEAISQGLPVIYTSGQGFDSQFNNGSVGYFVDPTNISDIASKICKIISQYEDISCEISDKILDFNWDLIAMKYINLYQESLIEVKK